jgi:hypothetical protein
LVGLPGSLFGPEQRRSALARLGTEVFDVLVLGGGVTGCGIALDAASRGLSVALVEKRDWAAGTSSRSSKLIHGGLRYLENLDIELVREALHERRLLVEKLAPHLVHPTPILFPLKRKAWDRVFMGSGLLLYDILAGLHPAMPRHRHLSRGACLRAVPSLREDAFSGGIRFYDAQVDDARFSLVLMRTAAMFHPEPADLFASVLAAYLAARMLVGRRYGKGAAIGLGYVNHAGGVTPDFVEAGGFEPRRLLPRQHAERGAGFEPDRLDAFDHGADLLEVAVLRLAPGRAHAEARGAVRLRRARFGEHGLDRHQLLGLNAGVVLRGLWTIRAVFRAAAGLDRQ